MSAATIRRYEQYRRDVGLPPTEPPPPMADDVRRVARKATALAGHVLALANESDPIAARALRRIGNGVLSDAHDLEQVATSLEARRVRG
jgi:hypothetical protein